MPLGSCTTPIHTEHIGRDGRERGHRRSMGYRDRVNTLVWCCIEDAEVGEDGASTPAVKALTAKKITTE